MTCDRCGEPCHGRYCVQCSRMLRREGRPDDPAEPDTNIVHECTSCGREYTGTGPCPECGSRRRRYAGKQ